MRSDWWTLHYEVNGLVHLADLDGTARAWCILRCDPTARFETSKGDVLRPVNCMTCLAEEHR